MPSDTSSAPDDAGQDIPVEIIGYVTDPKLVGYQILTNYESTYWRSLVGRDAWALYEVLRSFCHEGNDTCRPSIKLLMNILGITDRRQLTGRVTTTRGKERMLPGLIDILQDYKLAVAEMKGEGPLLRYVFHVNLTPPPLSAAQLKELPKRLQRKHAELLERVAEDVQKLDKIERKKPKKRRQKEAAELGQDETPDFSGSSGIFSEGGGTVPGGPGRVPGGGGAVPGGPGTVPPEQHPQNNTQKTTTVVVEKLEKYHIDSEKAEDLAASHSVEHIEEMVAFLEWKLMLQDSGRQRRGRPITDPAGWLIRAIERDYQPPKAFYKHREQAKYQAQLDVEGEDGQQLEIEKLQRTGRLEQLMEEHGTTQHETALWKAALDELKLQMPRSTYDTWLSATRLLSLSKDEVAVIAVANTMAQDWIENRLASKIKQTLAGVADQPVDKLSFAVLASASDSASDG